MYSDKSQPSIKLTIFLLFLLSIAIALKLLQKGVKVQIFTPLLLIISTIMMIFAQKLGIIILQDQLDLTSITFIFLPPFISYFSYQNNWFIAFKQVKKILLLSFPINVMNIFLITLIISWVSYNKILTLFQVFILASILSYSDATIMQKMFRKSNVSKILKQNMVRQSIISFGICSIIISVCTSLQNGDNGFLKVLLLLVLFLCISIILGVIFGIVVNCFAKLFKNDEFQTFNIRLISGYLLSFTIQQVFSRINGIMALIAMNIYLKICKNKRASFTFQNRMFKILSFIAQSTILIVSGIQLGKVLTLSNSQGIAVSQIISIGLIYILSPFARFLSIAMFYPQFKRDNDSLSWRDFIILSFGSMKGVSSILMVLILGESLPAQFQRMALSCTNGIVCLNQVINACMLDKFIKWVIITPNQDIKTGLSNKKLKSYKEQIQLLIVHTKQQNKQFNKCSLQQLSQICGVDQLKVHQKKSHDYNEQIQLPQVQELEDGMLCQQNSEEKDPKLMMHVRSKFAALMKDYFFTKLSRHFICQQTFHNLIEAVDLDIDNIGRPMKSWKYLISQQSQASYLNTLIWLYQCSYINQFFNQKIYQKVYNLHQIITTYIEGIQSCCLQLQRQELDLYYLQAIATEVKFNKGKAKNFYYKYVLYKFPQLIKRIKVTQVSRLLLENQRQIINLDYIYQKINQENHNKVVKIIQERINSLKVYPKVYPQQILTAYNIPQSSLFGMLSADEFQQIMDKRTYQSFSSQGILERGFNKNQYIYFIGKGEVEETWLFSNKLRHQRTFKQNKIVGLTDIYLDHRDEVSYKLKTTKITFLHRFPISCIQQLMKKNQCFQRQVFRLVFPLTLQLTRQINKKYLSSINKESQWINHQFDYNDATTTIYQRTLHWLGNYAGIIKAWIPFCPFKYPYIQIRQGTKGLVERFGRCIKTLQPGFHFINPYTEKVTNVSLLTEVYTLQNQQVITKDNISVNIEACVFSRIIDLKIANYIFADIRDSVSQISYTALRTICGESTLQDILEKRQQIHKSIAKYVQLRTIKWGIYVENIYIKNLTVQKQTLSDLSMVSKTSRLSMARIISAEADVKSAKLMSEVSDILGSKPAMQMRHLETLQSVAKTTGQKIFFLPLMNEENSQNQKVNE